jgi:hypothetical protein
MKTPKKIKACGADYKVVFHRKLCGDKGEPLFGQADCNNYTIHLEMGMSRQKKQEVLLHEILHIIDFNKGFKLGEKGVNNLTLELIQVIRDNKIKIS